MTQINFDASRVDPSIPFDVLPSGKYFAEITKSEVKPTKAGDSSYLEFEFTILEGQYRGRKVWDRLCLNHRNQQTVEIARSNLSAICHSVGVLKPLDSNELHHIPLTITVKLKHDYDTDNVYNEIKGYAKRDSLISNVSSTAAGLAASQSVQYPQAPVNDNTPPWVR